MEFQTAENWVDYILGRQQVAQPGAVFNYSTGNTHLLAAAPTGAPPPPYGPAQYDTYMAFGAWGQFIIVVPELELVTVITSLIKGHGALSLGNVIGANLFNLVLVSGVSVTLAPFSIPQAAEIGGINASLVLDLPVMFLVMALLTLPALARGKLSRLQGLALLAIYAAFCVVQFTL